MADQSHRDAQLTDPEPISLALGIFTAVVSGVGALYQRSEHRRGISMERSRIRSHLLRADRALNRLDESYRSLISIYDGSELLERGVPFVPGENQLLVERGIRSEVDRIRSNAFQAGRELEYALDELSRSLDDDEAAELSRFVLELQHLFREAQRADELLNFLISLGILIRRLSTAVYEVAARYRIELSSSRLSLLDDTIERLYAKSHGGLEENIRD